MTKKRSKGFRRIENKRLMAFIYLILRVMVVGVMILQFFNKDYQNVFLCVLTLALFCLLYTSFAPAWKFMSICRGLSMQRCLPAMIKKQWSGPLI